MIHQVSDEQLGKLTDGMAGLLLKTFFLGALCGGAAVALAWSLCG